MGLRHLHRAGTLMLSAVMAVIGIALVVEALTGVGGVSVRLLAGVLFVAGGFGRLYVELRRDGVAQAAEPDDPIGPRGRRELPPADAPTHGPRSGRRRRPRP
jgi:hypothetical protein